MTARTAAGVAFSQLRPAHTAGAAVHVHWQSTCCCKARWTEHACCCAPSAPTLTDIPWYATMPEPVACYMHTKVDCQSGLEDWMSHKRISLHCVCAINKSSFPGPQA